MVARGSEIGSESEWISFARSEKNAAKSEKSIGKIQRKIVANGSTAEDTFLGGLAMVKFAWMVIVSVAMSGLSIGQEGPSLFDMMEELSKKVDKIDSKVDALDVKIDKNYAEIFAKLDKLVLPSLAKVDGADKDCNTYSYPKKTVYVQPVVSEYKARWTFPGDLTTRLQTSHGQNVSGMSVADQLKLQDSLHDGSVVSRTVTRSVAPVVSYPVVRVPQVRYTPVYSTSNCPGGVCPVPSRTRTTTESRFGR